MKQINSLIAATIIAYSLFFFSCGSKKNVEKRNIRTVNTEQTDSSEVVIRNFRTTENRNIDSLTIKDVVEKNNENISEAEKTTRIVEKFDSVGRLDTRWITVTEKDKNVSKGIETSDKSKISMSDKTKIIADSSANENIAYKTTVNENEIDKSKIDNETDSSKGIRRISIFIFSISFFIVLAFVIYMYFKRK